MTRRIVIAPQAGPQTLAASLDVDMLFYGGKAGGGKSWLLTYLAGQYVHVPKYSGVIFRRDSTQIRGGGSLWDESMGIYPYKGGRPIENRLEWHFSDLSKVLFRHLQHEKDRFQHQGKQYAFVGWDELTHFTELQFWYLWSRVRSVSGVRGRFVATMNPDPDHFARDMVDWYIDDEGFPIPERSGVIRWFVRPEETLVWADTPEELREKYPHLNPISFAFVKADLEDNKILLEKDPDYVNKLMSLPRRERDALLKGNWNAKDEPGDYFDKYWFQIVDTLPAEVLKTARGWDKAATPKSDTNPDPDWTRGVKVARLKNGQIAILDMASTRSGPGGVDLLMKSVAKHDGKQCIQACWRDPGQAGVVDEEHTRNLLEPIGVKVGFERAAKSKTEYAKPVSAYADPETPKPGIIILDPEGVSGQPSAWVRDLLRELQAFPDPSRHDDAVDALSRAFRCVTDTSPSAERMRKAMGRIQL